MEAKTEQETREAKRAELLLKLKAAMAKKKEARGRWVATPPPRYDEVYYEGTRWLDSL